MLVEHAHQLLTQPRLVITEGDGEAEPGRLGARSGARQNQIALHVAQRLLQESEVVGARVDESLEPGELRQADGGLHIGDLQVVAGVRVGEFVIVPLRQVAELPPEAAAAGVVGAWIAVAIAAPVADRLELALQLGAVGEYRAAFAHGDMMGRVEAERANVAEGADHLTVIAGAERVAAILDDEQIVLFCHPHDLAKVERIAQRMRQDDGAGAGGDGSLDQGGLHVVGRYVGVDEDGN